MLFASFRRTMIVTGVAALVAAAPAAAADQSALPAGGKYKDCHGYIRHVSSSNIRVHCIDGNPADLSFLYIPKYTNLRDGKSVQTKDLAPKTPVHVIFTQSLGIRKAYKIFIADPAGKGLYGFKS
ncbi:MAG: hypothetical protein NVSMB64_26560 [Candidatus Velthaea sp.]